MHRRHRGRDERGHWPRAEGTSARREVVATEVRQLASLLSGGVSRPPRFLARSPVGQTPRNPSRLLRAQQWDRRETRCDPARAARFQAIDQYATLPCKATAAAGSARGAPLERQMGESPRDFRRNVLTPVARLPVPNCMYLTEPSPSTWLVANRESHCRARPDHVLSLL